MKDAPRFQPRVVVKFRDEISLPYRDRVHELLEQMDLGSWSDIARMHKDISLDRLHVELAPERIRALVDRAVKYTERYRPPNFLTYFAIRCPEGVDPEQVTRVLAAWKSVQAAYVEGPPTDPPDVKASDDDLSPKQGYLDPAPDGVDAHHAWTVAGGDGANVTFADVEKGWVLDHEDLKAAGVALQAGSLSQTWHGHGTAVLGILRAVDNDRLFVGIAPASRGVAVSQWRTGGAHDTVAAIASAITALGPGDVLLLEAQTTLAGAVVPVEAELAAFDKIQLAVASGITVIEAAANGAVDLDAWKDPSGAAVLGSGGKDSGAILVGAASAPAPHARLSFSNFGSRVDCYGWGEKVYTTGNGTNGKGKKTYTAKFSGTSSASAIVAGAALSLQGIARAALGAPYPPRQLRDIFRAVGTLSANPQSDRIGRMPDLKAAATPLAPLQNP